MVQSNNCKICKNGQHPLEICTEFLQADPKQRWDIARTTHDCFSCLKKHHGPCSRKVPCGISGCTRFHHRLLHKSESAVIGQKAITTTVSSRGGTILKTVPVNISGPKGQMSIVAFLDEGSTVSMIDSELAAAIGVEGPVSPLCCMWTGGISRDDKNSQKVSIELSRPDSNKAPFKLTGVRTFKNLELPKQKINFDELYEKYPYTKHVQQLAECPKLLIGQDNCDLIVSRESVQPTRDAPMLTLTNIGWVVHGPASGVSFEAEEIVSVNVCCEDKLDDLNNFVKQQMSRQKSEDERKTIAIAQTTINRVNAVMVPPDEAVIPRSNKWVPTKINPADKATREVTTGLTADAEWFVGPTFLGLPPENWSKEKLCNPTDEFGAEVVESLAYVMTTASDKISLVNGLPDQTRFSNYLRLIRATTYIRRFVMNLGKVHRRGELLPDEIERSENVWHKSIQQGFSPKFLKDLKQISPYNGEDGIHRIRGRLRNATELQLDTRHPIILDGRHNLRKLLVHHYHVKAMHQGHQNILNDRPINFVSSDPEDPQSLTPNMLLKGRDEIIIAPGRFEQRDELLIKQWRISQHWVDEFWVRWLREYVPQLLPKRKWTTESINLNVGDVVKILNDTIPRGDWPIGRIVQVYPGEDGVVRVVKVQTSNGTIKRPTCKVVPIVLKVWSPQNVLTN